jgi:hypothetical protein
VNVNRLVHEKPEPPEAQGHGFQSIYVSADGDDAADGTRPRPVRSVHRAVAIARASDATGFRILLRGRDSFTHPVAMERMIGHHRCSSRAITSRFLDQWE